MGNYTSQVAFWNIFGQWVLSGEGCLGAAGCAGHPRVAFAHRCQFTLLQSQVPTTHAASCQATPTSHTSLPGHCEVLVAKVADTQPQLQPGLSFIQGQSEHFIGSWLGLSSAGWCLKMP